MTQTRGAALLGGTFSDAARARDAFDTLFGEGTSESADLDVGFYGSSGVYLLLVAAKSRRAEDWATRVLREHGAAVSEGRSLHFLSDVRNALVHEIGRTSRRISYEPSMLVRWAGLAVLLMEQGLVEPEHLLALLVASGRLETSVPAEERRRRLKVADAELRDVSERLESTLRERRPDLFDRRGRLRGAELARRLGHRTGGKKVLTGDDLRALEEGSDAEAARSARAP